MASRGSAFGGLPVPAAITRGVRLRIIDLGVTELQVTAGPDGTGQASTTTLQQGMWLRIERIVVLGDSLNTAEITVYEGDDTTRPQRGRDWTQLPPGYVAVAEYPAFLTINPTLCATIAVTGAADGDIFYASVQYQLVAKVTADRI